MQLSLRLSAIAQMVTEGNRLVDVGCDHGYLPVYLVLEKKIPCAVAMDVRRGPLARAREHIAWYGLEKYIETRLSDGLQKLKAGEGDTLVIAGMGGPLMERILLEGAQALEGFSELILQPQSEIPHFRRFLLESGYKIVDEKIILEEGKFYFAMKGVPVKERPAAVYTPVQEQFGRLLLEERSSVLRQYLERERGLREEILRRLDVSASETAVRRRKEIEEEMRLIAAALQEYEGK